MHKKYQYGRENKNDGSNGNLTFVDRFDDIFINEKDCKLIYPMKYFKIIVYDIIINN